MCPKQRTQKPPHGHRSPIKIANSTNGGHLFRPGAEDLPGGNRANNPPPPPTRQDKQKPGREGDRSGWEAPPPQGTRRMAHTSMQEARCPQRPWWVQLEKQRQPKEDQPKGHPKDLSKDSAVSLSHLPAPIPEDLDPKGGWGGGVIKGR